jgi:hypothetical protein
MACSTQEEMRNAYKILVGKPERKRLRPRCRWEKILKWILGKMWYRLDSSVSGEHPVAGCCECGNESSDSIKGQEFLGQLNIYLLTRRSVLQGVNESAYNYSWEYFHMSLNSQFAVDTCTDFQVCFFNILSHLLCPLWKEIILEEHLIEVPFRNVLFVVYCPPLSSGISRTNYLHEADSFWKLIVTQLVKIFPDFYGIWRFITVLTRASEVKDLCNIS